MKTPIVTTEDLFPKPDTLTIEREIGYYLDWLACYPDRVLDTYPVAEALIRATRKIERLEDVVTDLYNRVKELECRNQNKA